MEHSAQSPTQPCPSRWRGRIETRGEKARRRVATRSTDSPRRREETREGFSSLRRIPGIIALAHLAACATSSVPLTEVTNAEIREVELPQAQVAESRITESLRGWLTALARSKPASVLPHGSAGSPLSFSLTHESQVTSEGLDEWARALRTSHPRVEYRLARISVTERDGARFRLQFALERRAVDETGLNHIARSDQVWWIRLAPTGGTVVTSITETPRLAFPGTGPQIICF